jgi:hypothetical protein
MKEFDQQPTDTLKDIKHLMERSSRFISLSGLSGIAAGICALTGAWIAASILNKFGENYFYEPFKNEASDWLVIQLAGLGIIVFVAAFILAYLFTYRRSRKLNLPVWDHTSRRLLWNLFIPIMAGGFFILGMLKQGEWRFVAPACLIFYGLALINGSKYTVSDIRYLGYFEIILGICNLYWPGEGLFFWATGFGVLHIIYGAVMWWKYERKN